ncbi:MAG: Holliday junction resolvase RuvX [Clostridia bacterium]|nr:Holliday junction resolvase RuvX [Clostridia bacterium]
MIIMAVDYGDSRTGIAVSDPMEKMAFPKTVIKAYNINKVVDAVLEQAEILKAEMIVIGNPKNMDGTEGFRSEKCKELSALIQEKTELKVILWDERLSTVSAYTAFNEVNLRGKKRKDNVDAQAAVVILQSYLDYSLNH